MERGAGSLGLIFVSVREEDWGPITLGTVADAILRFVCAW